MPATPKINPLTDPHPKLLIAGGRDYRFTDYDRAFLDGIQAVGQFRMVVNGGCSGADLDGQEWGKRHNLIIRTFMADWQAHGRSAGPKRNDTMARYLACSSTNDNLVVLLPGGRGTDSMRQCATRYGLRVIDVPART